jgi:general secretion pathway protein D
MRAGETADQLQDYDRAIVEYTKVLRADPGNRAARQALDVAKLRSSTEHFGRARRFEGAGRLDEALIELQLASELNPANGEIDDLLGKVRTQLRTKAAAREGKTELEALIERSRALMPLGLDLPSDIRMPDTLTFREASSRDVFTALGKIANINIIFDQQFRAQPLSIDLRNTSLEEALQAVSGTTVTVRWDVTR